LLSFVLSFVSFVFKLFGTKDAKDRTKDKKASALDARYPT
jgi:hypothetical protein